MDRFYDYNTSTEDATNIDNKLPITHETITEYLYTPNRDVLNFLAPKNYLLTSHVFKFRPATDTFRSALKTEILWKTSTKKNILFPIIYTRLSEENQN